MFYLNCQLKIILVIKYWNEWPKFNNNSFPCFDSIHGKKFDFMRTPYWFSRNIYVYWTIGCFLPFFLCSAKQTWIWNTGKLYFFFLAENELRESILLHNFQTHLWWDTLRWRGLLSQWTISDCLIKTTFFSLKILKIN